MKDKLKKYIVPFILGIVITLFGIHTYFFYKITANVGMNTQNIANIVNYLNSIPK